MEIVKLLLKLFVQLFWLLSTIIPAFIFGIIMFYILMSWEAALKIQDLMVNSLKWAEDKGNK